MKPWSAWGVLAAVVVALVTAPPAVAHHAIQAEYEMSKTGAFTGVMTRFAMINPHCRWFFEETKAGRDEGDVGDVRCRTGRAARRGAGADFPDRPAVRGDVRAREERRQRRPGAHDERSRRQGHHACSTRIRPTRSTTDEGHHAPTDSHEHDHRCCGRSHVVAAGSGCDRTERAGVTHLRPDAAHGRREA